MRFSRNLFLLLLLSLVFNANRTCAQTFSKLGIKCGFVLSGISTFNIKPPVTSNKVNTFIYDSTSFFNNLSVDLGLTAEWFNSDIFCLSTEVHYFQKGEVNVEYFTPEVKIAPNGSYNSAGSLYERASYLSLQLLPRVKVPLGKGDNYYFFGGPVFDFKLSDNGEHSNTNYVHYPGSVELGGTVGVGFEIIGVAAIEGRYQYNFNGPYDFKYNEVTIQRRYNCLTLLANFLIVNKSKNDKKNL